MNSVIPFLYISSYLQASDHNILEQNNIEFIINLSQLNIQYPSNIKVLNIDITDNKEEKIFRYFSRCNRFIHNARLKGKSVLIHCIAGVSRSPTIIIAYMIRKLKMNFITAYNKMKSIRPIIDINEGFIEELKMY